MRNQETKEPFSLRDYLVWCLSQNGGIANAELIEKALNRVASILKARHQRKDHSAVPDGVRQSRNQRIGSPLLLLTLAADDRRKYGSVLDLSIRDSVDRHVKS